MAASSKTRKANDAHFVFFCGNLPLEKFEVIEFEGKDCVSEPYKFTIELTSSDANISADDVVNKQATLFVFRAGEYYPYSGVISDFEYLETTTDYSRYTVILVPRLSLLSLNTQTRVFQKMTVVDIIKHVLDEANLKDYYTFETSGSYAENEYVVQYQETDLHFVSRLMEGAGLWYFFKEQPLLEQEVFDGINAEKLIISDKADSFINIAGDDSIVFRGQTGLNERADKDDKEAVFKMGFHKHVIPKEVKVKNYNYRTPEVALTGEAAIQTGDVGTMYSYGGGFKDTDGAQSAARLLSQRLATEQVAANGRSRCRGFRAGQRFALEEHSRDELNDTYLLREVFHKGAHSSMAAGTALYTYENEFLAMPSERIEQFRPESKTKPPQVNGIITATIEASGADYAALDDVARYKVRLPFDLSGNKNYEASKYVRLAQPYSGKNYGIHFPSHEGTEMVLACIDGDPNKPMGLGTVPNANTVSPVVSGNKEQSVIRTAGNNEMVFDDTADAQKVRITTNELNTIELDDENDRIYIQTAKENKLEISDKDEKVSLNAKDHNIVMSYGSDDGITLTTKGGHVVKIDDSGKKITIQSNGGNVVEMDDNSKKITLADGGKKNTVTLESGGLTLDTKGKLSLNATQDIEMKGANIKMNASMGALEAKAMTDVTISGMNISEKATMDHKVEGLNTSTKANLQAKTEANLGVEIKSNLQTKVSGTMAELGGTAMTTVKGGIVMIN